MSTPLSLDLLDARLRPLCDAYLGAMQVPGASIAVVSGDRAYHYAYGVKSLATAEPVTATTAFNIGSCSKAFTSTTVASLVADDLVSWDDPITKYVHEFQLYDPWVTSHATLRDLSANRLGLPREGLTEFGFDPSVPNTYIFETLRHTAPAWPFRDRCTYVNPGHTANAVAAGRVTGKGFLATVRERILEPLGMSGTSGGDAARDELPDQAAWHAFVDGKPTLIDTVYADQYLGTGGMVVSGVDALQWLRLHLNGGSVDGRQVIARHALLETHRPHSIMRIEDSPSHLGLMYPDARMGAYALGWAASDFEGHPLIAHSGGDYGIAAHTMLLPGSGIGIAVYANCAGGGAILTAYGIAAALLGMPPRDWMAYFLNKLPVPTPEPLSSEPMSATDLARCCGTYVHAADGPLVIERNESGLSGCLKMGYRMQFRLAPISRQRFQIQFTAPEQRSLSARDPYTLVFEVTDGVAGSATVQSRLTARRFERQTEPVVNQG
ncbi:MAG: serine hydrolase domain-containing protein [Steroidobacteraceae bacterium]